MHEIQYSVFFAEFILF